VTGRWPGGSGSAGCRRTGGGGPWPAAGRPAQGFHRGQLRNLAQLTALVQTRLRRMQYRPVLLEGFLASTRLVLNPFCNPHN
jgi:hypothetical protein